MANPNTSVFPGAIATDTTLLVATDNAYSALAADADNVVTDLTFDDAGAYTLPCLIALENEIVLAAGPKSGNTIHNCQRGFIGSAAPHTSGVTGYAYIFAYVINQLSAEIKAIESQLGINLANVIKTGATAAGDLSGTYPNPTVATVGGATASNIADAATKRHSQNTDTGTNQSTFQFGASGPKAKNASSTSLEIRNSGDTDYADLTVKNLTVKGTTTTIDSNNVNIGDNIITLNSDLPGGSSPTENAGFEVNRGNQPTVDLIWNESTQRFQCGVSGSEVNILLAGDTAGGDLAGTYPNPTIKTLAGLTAASYGDGTHVAVVTVNTKGQVTAISTTPITGAAPTGSAGGDLSGSFPNPTVATVGGVAAATVATGVGNANNATDTNTANRLVKRDVNGDFAARNITATLFNGPATGAPPTGSAGGDLAGTYPNPTLAAVSGVSGSWGSNQKTLSITVDGKGRITAISENSFRFVSSGSAATPSAGTGAGTSPTVSMTGNDNAGAINVTTGTSPAINGSIVDVTFATAFASAPKAIILTPGNAATAALAASGAAPFITSVATTGFTLKANSTGLTGATAYVWYFVVIG